MTPAHPEPTAAQMAAAFRTLADTIEGGLPDWLLHVVLEHCAPSMALVAKFKQKQKMRDGFRCRHCLRDGTVNIFDTIRALYLHGVRHHRDISAARALKGGK